MSFLSKRINEQKQREQEEILARENIARDFDEEEEIELGQTEEQYLVIIYGFVS